MRSLLQLSLAIGALLAASVAGSSAAASENSPECTKSHSMAWCVAEAGKLAKGLKDVSARDASAMKEKVGPAWYLGGAAATATKFWKPAYGFSRGGEVGMLLLSMLADGAQRPPLQGRNVIVGWMPVEMAANEEEANRIAQKILMDAMERAFAGTKLTLVTGGFETRSMEYAERVNRVGYRAEGGRCEEQACFLWQQKSAHNMQGIYDTRASRGKAPWFLGGYEAYAFEGERGSVAMWELVVDGHYTTNRYAGDLSKHLPEWMYVVTSMEAKVGKTTVNEGSAIPVVYHKGEALLMVFPEIEDRDGSQTVSKAE